MSKTPTKYKGYNITIEKKRMFNDNLGSMWTEHSALVSTPYGTTVSLKSGNKATFDTENIEELKSWVDKDIDRKINEYENEALKLEKSLNNVIEKLNDLKLKIKMEEDVK